MKIGIIRETKNPPDRRVPLSPVQCRRLLDDNPGLQIIVQPSPIRCFADPEYIEQGLPMSEDLSDCEVLLGVKEVEIDTLLPGIYERIREAGGNPFFEYQVPMAVLELKQGLGRLLRSGRDRGLLAVLDPQFGAPAPMLGGAQ